MPEPETLEELSRKRARELLAGRARVTPLQLAAIASLIRSVDPDEEEP
jgi:hypothetical protein